MVQNKPEFFQIYLAKFSHRTGILDFNTYISVTTHLRHPPKLCMQILNNIVSLKTVVIFSTEFPQSFL